MRKQKRHCQSLGGVQLFATLWTVAHKAPLSVGFSRQEYWSGQPFPSPGDLPHPGIEPRSPALQEDSLLTKPPGKPPIIRRRTQTGKRTGDYTKAALDSQMLPSPEPGAATDHTATLQCNQDPQRLFPPRNQIEGQRSSRG